jgi:hypothetical protein
MSKKKKIQSEVFYLFKITNNFVLIKENSLQSLTFKSILKLANNSFVELKQQLMLDAIGKAEFVENSKVVDELQKSLKKIIELHPVLIKYLNFNHNHGVLN